MEDVRVSSIEPVRKSVIVFMMHLFFTLISIDLAYAIILSFFLLGNVQLDTFIISLLLSLYLAKYMVQAYMITHIIMSWSGDTYVITNHHLICKKGIINTSEVCYACRNIRSVAVHQSWLGRILNYGDLIVEVSASGGYHEQVFIRSVTEPQKIETQIEEMV
jgi:uncharacterized membrane protein YdbT with pleckstrin-like domain